MIALLMAVMLFLGMDGPALALDVKTEVPRTDHPRFLPSFRDGSDPQDRRLAGTDQLAEALDQLLTDGSRLIVEMADSQDLPATHGASDDTTIADVARDKAIKTAQVGQQRRGMAETLN
ncbi:hypothetical protein [Antarctobacter heliothermus]|nr:hypothetical protein [Antarctobacter heliothermus]